MYLHKTCMSWFPYTWSRKRATEYSSTTYVIQLRRARHGGCEFPLSYAMTQHLSPSLFFSERDGLDSDKNFLKVANIYQAHVCAQDRSKYRRRIVATNLQLTLISEELLQTLQYFHLTDEKLWDEVVYHLYTSSTWRDFHVHGNFRKCDLLFREENTLPLQKHLHM